MSRSRVNQRESARVMRLGAAALSSLVLCGCNVGPEYAVGTTELPSSFAEGHETYGGLPASALSLVDWWTALNDPALDALVARAALSNLEIQVAMARVREARAARGEVAAEALPEVDAAGSFSRDRRSENAVQGPFQSDVGPDNLFQAGFDASWELDLFGRVRRGIEAADAEVEGAEEDERDALVSVIAEVVRNYAELRGFQRRLELAVENAALQKDTLGLTRSRFNAGLTSELDVAAAEAQLATTEALIPPLRQGITAATHRLGVLTGRTPEALRAELGQPGPIPVGPTAVDPGLPADLIERRPDLRAAERRVAAASARIGVATADLYPRIQLVGSLGLAAEDFSNLFEGASRTYSFGPNITWAVFSGGRIQSNIDVRTAQFDQERLRYEEAILVALEEVENALAAHRNQQEQSARLVEAVGANRRRVELAQERYERGIGDFLSVIDAQRQRTFVEDQLATSQQATATGYVALYKALGGGAGAF